jgi:RHS repeat-associated protein
MKVADWSRRSLELLGRVMGCCMYRPRQARRACQTYVAGCLLPILLSVCLFSSHCLAAEKTLTVAGANVTLADVTGETEVFYSSMRLNRALNVWNVEVTVKNKSSRELHGPFVLYVESASGTSGLLQPDGIDSVGNNPFLDLNNFIADGTLLPNQSSSPRTLSLGMASGTPQLATRVYAAPVVTGFALGLTRSLNEVGQPLPDVLVEESGPLGATTNSTDASLGLVTLGHGALGSHTWKFSRPGYLPVWRSGILQSNDVTVVPNPRLTPRGTNSAVFTPIAGGSLTATGIQINYGPGAFNQNTTGTVTRLTGQTLPAFLPFGWSPLQAFSFELSATPNSPANAALTTWGRIASSEKAVFIQWNEATLVWDVLDAVPGSTNLNFSVPGAGSFAVVVADTGMYAPAVPVVGQPLPAFPGAFSFPAGLTALGTVTPSLSPASRNPDLVTASAEVTITNSDGPLPSGLVLRCEVAETYDLADDTRRVLPKYEAFIAAYQRPGDSNPNTLVANFPLRPMLLLGGDELKQGNVQVDVMPPKNFDGGIFDGKGGQVAAGGVRVIAGADIFTNSLAINLRLLDKTNFLSFASSNVVYAFELGVGELPAGKRLISQFNPQTPNSFYVLARVLSRNGLFGLEPVERFTSDATGKLTSMEPNIGDRLPGITSGGQFLLLRVTAPQGIVQGVARDAQNQAVSGLPVRISGQPWLTFSQNGGFYRLLSPTGNVEVVVTDLNTGDSTPVGVTMGNWQTAITLNLAAVASGPRVVALTPADGSTNVARVTPVSITFSKPLNIGSAVNGSILLLGLSNQPVNATLSFNLKGNIATLLPVDPLAADTLHILVLSTNLADLSGYKLQGSNVFAFRTQSELISAGAGAQLISHEPTNGVVYMHGSQGMAEPGKPVILVNETTGFTTTVLAKTDGSFEGTIPASVDDYLTAVFVNGNGTRNSVPVNRQIFADGSVGLFNGGGTVDFPSPNGPFQLIAEPGSIANKTVIKAEYVAPTNYPANVTNTPPEGGKLVGAFKFSGHGDEVTQGIDISFPVKVEELGLAAGDDPTNASFALVVAREMPDPITGETNTAYEIIDRMHYENGRLVTHSPPFMGLLLSLAVTHEIIVYTALQASGGTIAISGYVFAAKVPDPSTRNYTKGTEHFLPGAVITAIPPNLSVYTPGVMRPGTFYAVASGTNAHFATMVPYYANGAVSLWATHPKFPGQTSLPFVVPALTPNERFMLGNVMHPSPLIFPLQTGKELDDHTPPTLTFSQEPDSPQPGVTNSLVVLSRDDGSRPTITVTIDSVSSLVPGTNITAANLSLTRTNSEEVGLYGRRDSFQIVSPIAARVDLKAVSQDGSGNQRTGLYAMLIGASPLSATNTIPPGDPHDNTGPLVIRSMPTRGSSGFSPGQPIVLRFNEPIDRAVLDAPGALLMNPAAGKPELHLSPDQLELTIFYYNLLPDTDYSLTLTPEVKDISGNRLDQNPAVVGNNSFELAFHTAESPTTSLPDLEQGGGAVVRGIYTYVLDRGSRPGVKIYDLSNPTTPTKVSEYLLPLGYPRDLVLIPNYSFKTTTNSEVQTKDLLAVVGGFVGEGRSQYLRVIDISDPLNPTLLTGASLNQDPSAVVSRVQWSPPMLDYLENGSLSVVDEVNLQELIIGEFLTLDDYKELPEAGRIGIDANGDGDFVDEGDQLPLPPRISVDFVGKSGVYALGDTDQFIDDFAMGRGGDFIGVVVDAGKNVNDNTPVAAAYRTLVANGEFLIREAASYEFTNARPKRVSLLFDLPLNFNGQIKSTDLALVSIRMNPGAEEGKANRIAVINVTDPEDPKLLTEIAIPDENGDSIYGITRRADGILMAATANDILLLDPMRFLAPRSSDTNAPHPAIVGVLPGAGDAMRTFDGTIEGLNVASFGGKNVVLQSAPTIEVVSFPETTPFNPRDLVNTVRTNIETRFSFLRYATVLPPAQYKGEPGITPSTISPPDAHNHFYVLVHAPGSAGESIELALESLNWAGQPLAKKGFLFPPVNALSAAALDGLGQTPKSTDAPTRSCRAWRLSQNPASPYYNLYLSRPFAVVAEEMSVAQLAVAKNEFDREILWGGNYVRISLDPSMSINPVLGHYAGKIDGREKVNLPGVETILPTHAADYIQSQNPGPITGGATLPSTMNALSAHNGEMNINLECLNLPGRRLPIIFRINYSGQSLYEGPLGRGWDFNYNQRIEELNEVFFPEGTKIPLVLRDTPENSEIAFSKDLIFNTGAGRKVIYKYSGTNAPAEIAADPLVAELGWTNRAARYYLPPDGLFNFFVKFKDGQFARLDTDGTQHWYNSAGKLVKVYDRYPENSIELVYGRRGELIQIKDELRRPVDIGYWRVANDPEFRSGVDQIATKAVELGKICRLVDYSKRDLLFYYTDEGLLDRREGPKIETATPGSFTGRAITRFVYSGTDRLGASAQSLVGVIGADETGTPTVNATEMGSKGRDVVDKFKIANQPLSLEMAHQNTARSLAEGNGGVEITTADQSKIKHTFDKFGRPLVTEFLGTNGAPRKNIASYYPNGLLRSMTYPEGNSITYIYDTNNPSVRSRGNLTMVIKSPGPRGGPTLTANTQYDYWYNLPAGIKTDFNGVEAQITLRPDHRDTQEIRIGSATEQFVGNDFGLQTKYIGIDGVEQSWTYNADGFVDTLTSGSGAAELTTRYIYEPIGGATSDQTKRGFPSAIRDAKGVSTAVVYDERNLLVRATRAGVTTTHSYNLNGNEIETATTIDTGLQLVEKRGYNQLGFMTNHIVKDLEIDGGVVDKVTTIIPDDLNRVKELILPSGDHHLLTYDHMGNVIGYEIVGSYSETYTYDLNGNRTSKTVGGATEKYEYDGHDRMIKMTTPTGTTIETVYDNNGNSKESSIHDRDGKLLARDATIYDELNRPRSITQDREDGQSTSSYDFNASQRSATITDPLGAKTMVYYDQAGRPERVLTPTGTNYYHFDPNDNLERLETEEGGSRYSERWERNERDHVLRAFDNKGNVISYDVRLDGANTSVRDRENHLTSRTLTRIGEVLTETGPNNVIKRFAVTTNGLLSSIKDTAFNGMNYKYEADGRLLETRLPNNETISYSDFNALSLPTRIQLPRGITIETAYDSIGKTTNRTVRGLGPERIENYGYDGLQRLTSLTDPSGSMVVDYDLFGFIQETKRTYLFADGPSGLTSLEFSIKQTPDAAANVETQTYPGGSPVVTHHRDITGRLKGLDLLAGETVLKDTVYAGDLRIGQRVFGTNSMRLENQYDDLRRVTARRYTRIADGKLLAEVRYAFDKNGAQVARQYIHRGGRTDFFGYDDGYRLTRFDQDVRPRLDGVSESIRTISNFVKPNYVDGLWRPGKFAREAAYSTRDVLQSLTLINPDSLDVAPMGTSFDTPDAFSFVPVINGFARSRDEVGNVTKSRIAVRVPGQLTPQWVEATFTYNDLGQMTKVTRADGVEVINDYDMAGLRIRRRVVGSSSLCVPSDTAFIYDGGKLIEERDLSKGGTVIARYFYGDEGDELIAGDVVSETSTNLVRRYYLTDVMKSVMAIADSEGNVLERINYDAWGQPSIQAADTQAPTVARVINETNALLVVFSEPVLPTFDGSLSGSNLVNTLRTLQNAFELRAGDNNVDITVAFEENAPLYPFGSVFRLHTSQNLSGSLTLNVQPGVLQDEWNNTNSFVSIPLDASSTNAVLFAGSLPGITAPVKLNRSSSSLLFHGQVFDFDAGLLYCRARYYDPTTGMFLQRDPAGYEDSVNQYAGFANNPVNFRDPTGMFVWDPDSWGRSLTKYSEGFSIRNDGLGLYMVGSVIGFGGAVLRLGTATAEGVDLLNSDAQGTFGLLDRIRGAQLVANDAMVAFGAATTAYSVFSGITGRVRGYISARNQYYEFGHNNGLTQLDLTAHRLAMGEMAEIYEARTVEAGHRRFKKPVQRRQNAERLMANKPGHVLEKTGPEGWVYKDGKFYNSDADMAYLEIDGRPATFEQEEHFNRLVKKHYEAEYRRLGYKGTPSCPVQHGVHTRYPDHFGEVVNGHMVDTEKLTKVGHPGDVFALKWEDGRMSGFHKSRWEMHNKLLETERRYMSWTGARLPEEWTQMSLHPTIGSVKDAAKVGKVFTPRR